MAARRQANYRLQVEVLEALKTRARIEGISESDLVGKAIERYLSAPDESTIFPEAAPGGAIASQEGIAVLEARLLARIEALEAGLLARIEVLEIASEALKKSRPSNAIDRAVKPAVGAASPQSGHRMSDTLPLKIEVEVLPGDEFGISQEQLCARAGLSYSNLSRNTRENFQTNAQTYLESATGWQWRKRKWFPA